MNFRSAKKCYSPGRISEQIVKIGAKGTSNRSSPPPWSFIGPPLLVISSVQLIRYNIKRNIYIYMFHGCCREIDGNLAFLQEPTPSIAPTERILWACAWVPPQSLPSQSLIKATLGPIFQSTLGIQWALASQSTRASSHPMIAAPRASILNLPTTVILMNPLAPSHVVSAAPARRRCPQSQYIFPQCFRKQFMPPQKNDPHIDQNLRKARTKARALARGWDLV